MAQTRGMAARLGRLDHPEIGDIAHIKADVASRYGDAYGLVSKVRASRDGEWRVELLIDGESRWFNELEIDQILRERNPFKRESGPNLAPCRIFALLGREAETGVIVRRGPTRWVQIIKWNTATDAFEPGQWFHGRLYEHRADLSPDGTRLIYFAAKMGRSLQYKDSFYAWTAISKPPYLTAIALWPKTLGTWFGGGLFMTDTHVCLNHTGCEADVHPDHQPPKAFIVTAHTLDPRYEAIFYARLHRDGWQVDQEWWQRYGSSGFAGAPRALHEKPHRKQAFRLVMESEIFSLGAPTYGVQDDRRGELTTIEGSTWADWDHRGRLVYGKEGKLLAAEVCEKGLSEPRELADFNAYRPEPREAPAWAKSW